MTQKYVVAGNRPWSGRAFDKVIRAYPGRWTFIGERDRLKLKSVQAIDPRYVFLLHWSWKVPEDLVRAYECIGFHMTDLPYGRGGSPLQNLILEGLESTKLTAFRMTDELDAGPVYMKRTLSLKGSAQEIYRRASFMAAEMIRSIAQEEPSPSPQNGKVVTFTRRRPEESELPAGLSLREIYNFIRMLDAEGYPRAFLHRHGFRYELSNATLTEGGLKARVQISSVRKGDED